MPEGAAAEQGEGGGGETGQVEGGVEEGKDESASVVAGAPPLEGDGEHVGAGAQGHVEEAGGGESEVVADGAGMDALGGEGGEGFVELRGGAVVQVVGGEEGGGLGVLRLGVEGAVGERGDVEVGAVVVPVDGLGGGEIDGPGAVPALKPGGIALAGVGGETGGEGFEDVHGVEVADGPGDEGEDGEEGEGGGDFGGVSKPRSQKRDLGHPALCRYGSSAQVVDGREDGGGEEALLGAEKDRVGEGGGEGVEPGVEGAAGKGEGGVPALEREEGQGDGEEGKGFGEGRGGVVGGEGTEGGEPEGCGAGARAEEAGGEAAEKDAGGEVNEDLEEDDGVVALLAVAVEAEEAEAGGEEEGVAGEADEGGADWLQQGRSVAVGDAVDAVAKEVVGDVAVEEGVALDVGVAVEEEETEEEAGDEGEDEVQRTGAGFHCRDDDKRALTCRWNLVRLA